MNSLSKLIVYESSDSGSDNENVFENPGPKLPVPDLSNIGIKSEEKACSQEIINHEGKVRNFPHEPGNWATYIHVDVDPIPEFLEYLNHLVSVLEPLNLKVVDDFHISLTRTVVLKHHWIQDFTECVKRSLCESKPFTIHMRGLKTYCNEQKTRSFLSLAVDEGQENLKEIVKHLDSCLEGYNLQSFYANPSFHLSLLWCAGNRCDEIDKFKKILPSNLKTFGFSMKVSHCSCTSGNKHFKFNFS